MSKERGEKSWVRQYFDFDSHLPNVNSLSTFKFTKGTNKRTVVSFGRRARRHETKLDSCNSFQTSGKQKCMFFRYGRLTSGRIMFRPFLLLPLV